ncbi:MAG: zinc ribbon domain-containing protein [bacterium]
MDTKILKEQWICPKCRGRGCTSQEMSMSKASDKIMLRGGSGKYLVLSCTLCGYTELYNLKVLARVEEKVSLNNSAPVVERADLIESD